MRKHARKVSVSSSSSRLTYCAGFCKNEKVLSILIIFPAASAKVKFRTAKAAKTKIFAAFILHYITRGVRMSSTVFPAPINSLL